MNSEWTHHLFIRACYLIRIKYFTKQNDLLFGRSAKVQTPNRSITRHIKHLFVIFALLISTYSYAADVIVNPSVSQSTISQNTLRAIFGMRLLQWPDGEPITVFILPPKNPVHENFIKERLGVFPHQLERNWDLLVFSGTGQPPISVRSENEMRKRIAETPGAIGYLLRKNFDESVRLLQVQ